MKIGDRVRCTRPTGGLELGQVYTVSVVGKSTIELAELRLPYGGARPRFGMFRFELA